MTTHIQSARAESWPDEFTTGHYQLDSDTSALTFTARHLFGLGRVTGSLRITTGRVDIDAAHGSVSLAVDVDAASFTTGNERRDADVRSAKFLDTATHPQLGYRANAAQLVDGRWWIVPGELTVRATAAPVSVTVTLVEVTSQGFQVHASTRIERYAFGITAAKWMAGRYLDVYMTAVAERR